MTTVEGININKSSCQKDPHKLNLQCRTKTHSTEAGLSLIMQCVFLFELFLERNMSISLIMCV